MTTPPFLAPNTPLECTKRNAYVDISILETAYESKDPPGQPLGNNNQKSYSPMGQPDDASGNAKFLEPRLFLYNPQTRDPLWSLEHIHYVTINTLLVEEQKRTIFNAAFF